MSSGKYRQRKRKSNDADEEEDEIVDVVEVGDVEQSSCNKTSASNSTLSPKPTCSNCGQGHTSPVISMNCSHVHCESCWYEVLVS